MEFIPFYITNCVLIVIIIVLLILWRDDRKEAATERKDLYTRLMSKDVVEYSTVTAPEENKIEDVEDPDLVSIDSDIARKQMLGEEPDDE